MGMREEASISGNKNIFQRFQDNINDNKKKVFGAKGKGVYSDQTVDVIREKVD